VSFNKSRVVTNNANYSSALSLVLGPVNRVGYPGDALFQITGFAGINNAGSPLYWNAAASRLREQT